MSQQSILMILIRKQENESPFFQLNIASLSWMELTSALDKCHYTNEKNIKYIFGKHSEQSKTPKERRHPKIVHSSVVTLIILNPFLSCFQTKNCVTPVQVQKIMQVFTKFYYALWTFRPKTVSKSLAQKRLHLKIWKN